MFNFFLEYFLIIGYVDLLAQLTKVGEITEEKYQSKNSLLYRW